MNKINHPCIFQQNTTERYITNQESKLRNGCTQHLKKRLQHRREAEVSPKITVKKDHSFDCGSGGGWTINTEWHRINIWDTENSRVLNLLLLKAPSFHPHLWMKSTSLWGTVEAEWQENKVTLKAKSPSGAKSCPYSDPKSFQRREIHKPVQMKVYIIAYM